MPRDVDLEPLEQGDQRTVEMEAVATPSPDHAVHARERLDPRRRPAVDVDVLVRDPRDVRPPKSGERCGVDLPGGRVDAEMLEVRRSGAIR